MFMGVVGKPNNQQNFDGKIAMIRISRPHTPQRDTYHHNFHHDRYVNQLMMDNWRELHIDNLTFQELKEIISDTYEVDEDITDSICFRFVTLVGINRRNVYMKTRNDETIENTNKRRTDANGDVHNLTLEDLEITCFNPRGTVIERNCSCDSDFMLQKMNLIGAEIRRHTPWIPRDRSINLILDNAGGHGTRAAKEQYTRQLLDNHNIIIIWQPPRSPELNVLDLGL
jgi:hypothetical protein